MKDKEVKITNFSPLANLYRNTQRELVVDPIFEEKQRALNKGKKYKAEKLDLKARLIWRDIVKTANDLF